jgi:hypothetical protein
VADQTVRALIGTFGLEALSGTYTTNDGVALNAGDDVLVLVEVDPTKQRIYTVVSGGPWTPKSVTYTLGMDVRVLESPFYGAWRMGLQSPSSGTITPGTTVLTWYVESWRDIVQPGTGLAWDGNGPGGLELPIRPDVAGEHDIGPLSLSLTNRGVVDSIGLGVGQETYIEGFIPSWVSGGNPIFSAGAAWVPGSGAGGVLEVPTDQNGPVGILPAADLMYFYLQPTTTAPNVAGFTTAPAAAYLGTARNKSGDANSRYVAALRTNAGGTAFYNFHTQMLSDKRLLISYLEDTTASPFRVVSGGTATTNQTVNLGPSGLKLVPPSCRMVWAMVAVNATANVWIDNSEMSTSPAGGSGHIQVTTTERRQHLWIPLDGNQSLRWANNTSGGSTSIDIKAYIERR